MISRGCTTPPRATARGSVPRSERPGPPPREPGPASVVWHTRHRSLHGEMYARCAEMSGNTYPGIMPELLARQGDDGPGWRTARFHRGSPGHRSPLGWPGTGRRRSRVVPFPGTGLEPRRRVRARADQGEGMRFRGRSIRHKIVVLLLVPLLALVALWGFATALTLHEARQLTRVSHLVDEFGGPAADVVRDLRRERRETIVHLADPRGPREELRGARQATDRSIEVVRANASGPAREHLVPGAAEALVSFLEALEHLERAREQVDSNTLTRTGALDAYNAVAEPGLRLQSALHLLENVELDRHGRAVASLGMVAENVSRIDALVAGALAAGRMTDREHRALSDAVAERGLIHRLHLPDLPSEDRRAHENFWQAGQGRILREAEERVVEQGVGGVQPGRWEEITAVTLDELRILGDTAARHHAARVEPAAGSILLRAAFAGVAGLAAVLLSIGISLRVGRGLTHELRALSDRATEAAEVRLPEVMNRLAAGERVEAVGRERPAEFGPDEVGR
ncbi:hypothetical protein FNQ90_09270, partial [Streptomyces alkaliphilus]|nr:hypothetical protein [Streptomyces alkaliphilus]